MISQCNIPLPSQCTPFSSEIFLIGAVLQLDSGSVSRRRRKHLLPPGGTTNPKRMPTASSEEYVSSENDSNYSEDSLMCAEENRQDKAELLGMMTPTVDEIRNVTHSLEGMTYALMLSDEDQASGLLQGPDLPSHQEVTLLQGEDLEGPCVDVEEAQRERSGPSAPDRSSVTEDSVRENSEVHARQDSLADPEGQIHVDSGMDKDKAASELDTGQVVLVLGLTNRKMQQLVMSQVDVWHSSTESQDQMHVSVAGLSEYTALIGQMAANGQLSDSPESKRRLLAAFRVSEADIWSTVESKDEGSGDEEQVDVCRQTKGWRKKGEELHPGDVDVDADTVSQTVNKAGPTPSADVVLMEREGPDSLTPDSDVAVEQSQHRGHVYSEMPENMKNLGTTYSQELPLGTESQNVVNTTLQSVSGKSNSEEDHTTPSTIETQQSTAATELSIDLTTAPTELSTDLTTAPTELSTDFTTAPTELSTDLTTAPTELSTYLTTAPTELFTDLTTEPTELSTDHTTAPTELSIDHTTDQATAATELSSDITTAPTELSTDHTTAVKELSTDQTTATTELSTDHTTAPTELSRDHTTSPTELSTDHTTATTEMSTDHTTSPTELSTDHTTAPTELSTYHTTAPTELSTDHTTATTEMSTDHTTAPTELSTDHTTATAEMSTDHTTAPTELSRDHTTSPTELSTDHTTATTEMSTDHTTAPTELSRDHTTSPTELSIDHTTAPTELSIDHTTAPTELSTDHTTSPTELSTDHTTATTEMSTDHTTATTEMSTDHTTAPTELSTDHTTSPTELSIDHTTAPTELSTAPTELSTGHITAPTELTTGQTTAASELSTDHMTPHATPHTTSCTTAMELSNKMFKEILPHGIIAAEDSIPSHFGKVPQAPGQDNASVDKSADYTGSPSESCPATEAVVCTIQQEAEVGHIDTTSVKSAKTDDNRENRDSGYYSLPRGAVFGFQYASDGNTMTSPSESEEDSLHRSGDKETNDTQGQTDVSGRDKLSGNDEEAQTEGKADDTTNDTESTSADKFKSTTADVESINANKFQSSASNIESDFDIFQPSAADIESTDADIIQPSAADIESTDVESTDDGSTDADIYQPSLANVESTDADMCHADTIHSTTTGNIESAVELSDTDITSTSAHEIYTDDDECSDTAEKGQPHLIIDSALSTSNIVAESVVGENTEAVFTANAVLVNNGLSPKEDTPAVTSAQSKGVNVCCTKPTDPTSNSAYDKTTTVPGSDGINIQPSLEMPKTISAKAVDTGSKQEDCSDKLHSSTELQLSHSAETIAADRVPATSVIYQDMTIQEPHSAQPSNNSQTKRCAADPDLAGGLSSSSSESQSSVTPVEKDFKAGLCMLSQPVTSGSNVSELNTASQNVVGQIVQISEQSNVLLTQVHSACGTEPGPAIDTAEPCHVVTASTLLQPVHGASNFTEKLLSDYTGACKQPLGVLSHRDEPNTHLCSSQSDYPSTAGEQQQIVSVHTADHQHDLCAGHSGGHEECLTASSWDNVPVAASGLPTVDGSAWSAVATPCVKGLHDQLSGCFQTPTTDSCDPSTSVNGSQILQSETVLELQEEFVAEICVPDENCQVNAVTDSKHTKTDGDTEGTVTRNQNPVEPKLVPDLSQETGVERSQEGISEGVVDDGCHLEDIHSQLYSIDGDVHNNNTAGDSAVTNQSVGVLEDNNATPLPMADSLVKTADAEAHPALNETEDGNSYITVTLQSEFAPSAVNQGICPTAGRTDNTHRDIPPQPVAPDQTATNLVKSKLHLQPAHDDDEALFDGSTDVTPSLPSDIDAGHYKLVHFKAPELEQHTQKRDGEDDVRKMESLEKSAVIFLMDADFDELIQNVVQEGWEYATMADTDGGNTTNGMSDEEHEPCDVIGSDVDGPDEQIRDGKIFQDGKMPSKCGDAPLARKESNLSMLVNVDDDQDEVMSDDEGDDDRNSITMADHDHFSQVEDIMLNQIEEWGTESTNPSLIPNIDEEPEELVDEDIEFMHGISTEDSVEEEEVEEEGGEDGSDDETGATLEPESKSDTRGGSTNQLGGAASRQGSHEGRPSSPAAASGGPESTAGGKKMDSEAVSVSFDDGYCTMLMQSDTSMNDSADVTYITVQDTSNEDTEHDVSFSTLGEVEECGIPRERTGSIPVSADVDSAVSPSRPGGSFEEHTQQHDVSTHFSPASMSTPHSTSRDMSGPVTRMAQLSEQHPPQIDDGSFMLLQYKEPDGEVHQPTEDMTEPLEQSQTLHMINSDFEDLANVVASEGWEYATVTTTGEASDEVPPAEAATVETPERSTDDHSGVNSLLRKASNLSMFVNTGDLDDQQMSEDDDTEVDRPDHIPDRLRLLQAEGNRSRNTSLLTTLGDEPEDINEEEIEFMRQELPRRANFTIGTTDQFSNNDVGEESGTNRTAPANGQLPSGTGATVQGTASGQLPPRPDGRSHLEIHHTNATPNGKVPCMNPNANTAKKPAVLVDTKVIGFDIQPDHPDSTSHEPELQHNVLFETQSRYSYFRDNGTPLLTADVQVLGVQPPMPAHPRQTSAVPEPVLRDHPTNPCQQHLKFSCLDIEIKPLKSKKLVCDEQQGRQVVEDGEEKGVMEKDEQDLVASCTEHSGDVVSRTCPPQSEGIMLNPRSSCNIAGTPISGGAYVGAAESNRTFSHDTDGTQQMGTEGSPEPSANTNCDVCADSTESVETVVEAATEDVDKETDKKAAQLSDAHVTESAKARLAWMHLFGMPTDDVCLLPKRYQTVQTQTSFDSSSSSSSSGSDLDTGDVMDNLQARLLISQFIEEAAEVIPPPDEDESSISSDDSRLPLSPGELDLYSSDTFLSSSSLESIPEDLVQSACEDKPETQWEPELHREISSLLLSDDDNMADTEDNGEQDASNDSITYVFLSHSRSLHEMGVWDDDSAMHRPTSASEPTCVEDTPRSYPYDTDHLGLPLKERSVSLDEIRSLHPENLSSGHRSISLDLSKQMLTEDIAPEDIFGGHFDDATESEPDDTSKHQKAVDTTTASCQVDATEAGASKLQKTEEKTSSYPEVATTGVRETSSRLTECGHEISGTDGLLETCEMTLEQPGEIAIRSEVRAAGLQVSSMHITDLVDASLHVETRSPGNYYINIQNRQRTIETQTYPEMRVIETQTSDEERKIMKEQRGEMSDVSEAELPLGPDASQTDDVETGVLTVDTGVNASPPGGQSPVLFSRHIKTNDHLTVVDILALSRLQELISKDSTTSCLDGDMSSQTDPMSSVPGVQQLHGLVNDRPSSASVHTQSECYEEGMGNPPLSRWHEVSAPRLAENTSDRASGPGSSDVTDMISQSHILPSPSVHVTSDLPAAEQQIQPKTSSGKQRNTTTKPSSLTSTMSKQLFSIDREMSEGKHGNLDATSDLQPCLVETARSTQVPRRAAEAEGQMSGVAGEAVLSSVPSGRLLDASVITSSLFSVDRNELVEGDSSEIARQQVQSTEDAAAMSDMPPKKPQYQIAQSPMSGPSGAHSVKVQSIVPTDAQERPNHTVSSAKKTVTIETPVKQHTEKFTTRDQSLHSKPSQGGTVGKTQNVKDKQSHKLTNSRDGTPAAQLLTKSKPQTSEASQAAHNLSKLSAEASKGASNIVTGTSKGIMLGKISRVPAPSAPVKPATVTTAKASLVSAKSPKSKHSTENNTPVSAIATEPGKDGGKTKGTSSKSAAPDRRDSEIQQIIKKYQAIKHLIETGATNQPTKLQETERAEDSKPAGPIHVTNIRMGDRYTVSTPGRRQTSRQSRSPPSRTRTGPAGKGDKEAKKGNKGDKGEDPTPQKDQAVGTDFAEVYYDDELERLRRERQRILDMLEKDVMPSKLQVELAEAHLNYIIGQTDTLLQALDEPWDSESLMAYTAHDEQLHNISKAYLSRYRTTLEQSRVDIEQRIVELEQDATRTPGRSRARQRHLLEQERRNAVESFKRERQLEQVNFELMKDKHRSRSLSPADGSVQSGRWTHTLLKPRGSQVKTTQSGSQGATSVMTPKQRCDYLVGLRKGIVRSTNFASSPSPSVSSGSPQVTPRGAISVLSPPFRSHSAGRASSHTSDVPSAPGFTLYHGNHVRSYSPAPARRTHLTYTSQSHRTSNIPSSTSYGHEAMDASSITSSLDEDSLRLLDDYQVTRGRTHTEIERAREVLQTGAGLHVSRSPAVHSSSQ